MFTVKQGIKLSAIIDKLELKISNPKASQDEVGADLMIQVVSKAHKAEKEVYAFIAEHKKISLEEAAEVDLFEFIQELFSDSKVVAFFKSAVKSKAQG